MSPAKAALQREPDTTVCRAPLDVEKPDVPVRLPNVIAGTGRTAESLRSLPAAQRSRQNDAKFQPRVPVITGEATYRGVMPVNGIISGQMNAAGGAINIKQRPRDTKYDSAPELYGEISFKEMLRVNGHVAGKVTSEKGTLIIDASAKVEAFIQVGVAVISGRVDGDVIGYERVELGPTAVLHGNISTPKLTIKPGAIFQGDCRVLKTANGNQ